MADPVVDAVKDVEVIAGVFGVLVLLGAGIQRSVVTGETENVKISFQLFIQNSCRNYQSNLLPKDSKLDNNKEQVTLVDKNKVIIKAICFELAIQSKQCQSMWSYRITIHSRNMAISNCSVSLRQKHKNNY